MSFLTKLEGGFLAALKYFPFILQGAIAIQGTMPDAPGASKKQILLSALGAAAVVGETIPEAHIQAVSALIDVVVASLKTSAAVNFTPAAPASASA